MQFILRNIGRRKFCDFRYHIFQMGYEPKTFSCTIVEKDNKSPEVFLIVVGIVIPFVIMAGCYGLIFYKVSLMSQIRMVRF